jgi:hypothetical protein
MSIYWINHDINSLYDDIPINPLAIHIFLIQISFLLKYVHVFPLFPIYLHAIPLVSPQYHHEKHGRGRPKHQCHIDTGRQRGVVRRLLVTYPKQGSMMGTGKINCLFMGTIYGKIEP